MQLKKIRLAGFKSFVDPTTIVLPSNLVGVVGPNGCGKSNIIDAVRWVLGESRARQLRGESMDDVIFNGSSARKPVGKAMVDLIFDNSSGRIGGQYAQYQEISIRRELTRDGASSYFLNGTRCRRRDIQDVFLGTGMGPGSYAIIEQGMISRLVEAKPEELRGYLEEAAGISRYKERRRETQNRLNRTNENISRINDIYNEVEKRLKILERQAAQAEKYREFKEQERELRALIIARELQALSDEAQAKQQALQAATVEQERMNAERTALESQIESAKIAHQEASEHFNEAQGTYYSTGGEVSRLETSIQHARQQREQKERDLQRARQHVEDTRVHLHKDEAELESLIEQIRQDEPALLTHQQAVDSAMQALKAQEQAMREWEIEWEQFNTEAHKRSRISEVHKVEMQHLEQQLQRGRQRISQITEELESLQPEQEQQKLAELHREKEEVDSACQALQRRLDQQNQSMQTAQTQRQELVQTLRGLDQEIHANQKQVARLEALQAAALHEEGEDTAWVEDLNLDSEHRLAMNISVEPDWEKAVEVVLQHSLNAIGCDDLEKAITSSESCQSGSVLLVDAAGQEALNQVGPDRLLSHLTSDWSLADFIGHVYCADTLEEALNKRQHLQPHESVVTRSGVWMGQHWLRMHHAKQDDGSVLERAAAIKRMHASLESLTNRQQTLRSELEKLEAQLLELQTSRESTQRDYQSSNEQRIQKEAAIQQLKGNVERQIAQRQKLEEELSALQTGLHQSEREMLDKQTALEQSSDALKLDQAERDRLSRQRDQLREQLETLRDQLRQHQQVLHDVSIRLETARVKQAGLESGIERMRQQLHERAAHQEQLSLMLEQSDTPISELEMQLRTALQKRIDAEAHLKECRARLEDIDQQIRDLDRQRIEKEQAQQAFQEQIAQTRLNLKENETRRETRLERIVEIGFETDAICEKVAQMSDSLEEMTERLDRLQTRIQRMEPVNLAAVDEYKQENERKTYLETQLADLREALETLETAMRKIDQETRSRFKETFERANASLQRFYPQLMGGGKAQMQLTEQDLLNTGVTVLAQPPGKRNTSIHMLSGGEKALTAIALVFSLFELNPAPFCVLDEVDAPLDDYNVGRYAEMIRQMSDKVQFIFITHNKITMDVANQLIGVTMHEAGVSRPVDVDIERAIELAAA